MLVKAVLARTTSDSIKSKIKSNQLVELVFEAYMGPKDFADLISKYYEKEFEVEIR